MTHSASSTAADEGYSHLTVVLPVAIVFVVGGLLVFLYILHRKR